MPDASLDAPGRSNGKAKITADRIASIPDPAEMPTIELSEKREPADASPDNTNLPAEVAPEPSDDDLGGSALLKDLLQDNGDSSTETDGDDLPDCCSECGKDEEELNRDGHYLTEKGVCTACLGIEKTPRCVDCGAEGNCSIKLSDRLITNELVYSDRFKALLCRVCLCKRFAALLGDFQYQSHAPPMG